MRLLEPRQILELRIFEHLDRDQRQQADQRARVQRIGCRRRLELVVVEAVLFVPQARCRRACSWRRRWRRSARRTSRPCPRRPDFPAPARAPSTAWSRNKTPSTRCRRPAADSRRSGSGCERSKTPMLSSPRKPPAKRLLPLDVLAVHPPGEVHQQLLEDAFEEGPIALAARPVIL